MINKQTLQFNIDKIKEEIAIAANEAGRSSDEITIVAVTKYVDAETTRLLPQCGLNTLGESRPQVLWEKAKALNDENITWHMIGHLQRNKVARTIEYAALIHSIDSMRLLKEIDHEAQQQGIKVNGLLQVNISYEENKHGFTRDELSELVTRLDEYPHVNVSGLMGMAGLGIDENVTQQQFAYLRELRDELVSGTSINLPHLSMGMSHDFHLAIKEGATIVRIGSRLFE